MKYLLCFALLCVACATKYDMDNLTSAGNGWVDSSTGQLADGIYSTNYDNGALFVEMPLKNGIQDGIRKIYYPSGEIFREIPYVNGKLEGIEKEYYRSGALRYETPMINGTMEGTERGYYESGALYYEALVKNNTIMERAKIYNEDGTLQTASGDGLPRKADLAQYVVPTYHLPIMSELRIWGWSTGKVAYSTELKQADEVLVTFVIFDLKHNRILDLTGWHHRMTDGTKLYQAHEDDIIQAMENSEIQLNMPTAKFLPFRQVIKNVRYDVFFSDFKYDDRLYVSEYELIIKGWPQPSGKVRSKVLGTFTSEPDIEAPMVAGFFPSPLEEDMLMVVIAEQHQDGTIKSYKFSGCNLNVGFEETLD